MRIYTEGFAYSLRNIAKGRLVLIETPKNSGPSPRVRVIYGDETRNVSKGKIFRIKKYGKEVFQSPEKITEIDPSR